CARRERRIGLAASIARGSRPSLILMSGLSGSGKSWLSERLVPSLGLLRVRSDLERKRVSGMPTREHAPAAVGHGLYGRAISGRTYAHLLECAEHALAGGYGIIVDAAFLEVGQREPFRELARRLAVPFLLVRCEADAGVLRRRVRERAASSDPSDATLAVLEHQLATARPLESRELPSAVIIDTSVNDAGLAAVHVVGARLARPDRPHP
ncbi:MAG TPA: ATP-binding protein, partial [Steroidobacteraceae bacterium]|nr:ATP-binding protein [Steroidobacteraceae bacterium]